MKILIDMNQSPSWVPFLVTRGFGAVIQVRAQDVLPSEIGDAVLRAIEAAREHLETGAIVTVDVARNRIRLLPI
jgi:predicted nuclease of predicted toxin-antitoxin system